MAEWVKAETHHIPLLQRFTCAEKRRWSGRRGGKRTETPSERAQNIVRNLRPGELIPPDAVWICIDRDSGEIVGVVCVMFEWQDTGALHVVVPIMAVVSTHHRNGLGRAALGHVGDLAAAEGMSRAEVPYVKIEAEVHPDNSACKALIEQCGWGRVGTSEDGVLETWAAMVELEDPALS